MNGRKNVLKALKEERRPKMMKRCQTILARIKGSRFAKRKLPMKDGSPLRL